ncbi:MAG: UDP-N-acetylmuramoyl-tripeptide--D-alanyl-D-alanine ligase, partial [Gammaproteobacteria bacterium]
AAPTIGVVTMCGPAHLAGFGSLAGVASAKGELFAALDAAGIAVINADDQFSGFLKGLTAARCVSFGIDAAVDYSAAQITELGVGRGSRFTLCTENRSVEITLRLDGRHNIYNALAAAAAATAAGATLDDVQRGLATVRPVPGRFKLVTGINGATLIDDTYNANPGSLAAALDVLHRTPGERWLVLGDMAELGTLEIAAHRDAGARAEQSGVERLFAIGALAREAALSFGSRAEYFEDQDELADALKARLHHGVTVLIKGSRRMQLDRLVAALTHEVPSC